MRRPTPSMAVAVVALVVACAGSATAATLITGADIRNNSVTGADIRDKSLHGKDIGANTVTGRNVSGLSGRDVIPNGLDGSDIDENTLDVVPEALRARAANEAASATRADSADALTHARIVRLGYNQVPGSAETTVYDEGGLKVVATCGPLGVMTVRATPSLGAGFLRIAVTRPGSPAETTLVVDNDFREGDAGNLLAGGRADNVSGQLTFYGPNTDVTTIQYLANGGDNCVLLGNAVHTSP